MKREFLEGLGLSKEQTDAVMSEYGKGLEALKTRNSELESKYLDYDVLKAEKDRIEGELEEARLSHSTFRRGVICELVDGARPSSSLAREELIRRLESCPADKVYSALNELRESEPSAFLVENDHPVFSSFSRSEEAPAPINFIRRR